jgi:hypothetical protein
VSRGRLRGLTPCLSLDCFRHRVSSSVRCRSNFASARGENAATHASVPFSCSSSVFDGPAEVARRPQIIKVDGEPTGHAADSALTCRVWGGTRGSRACQHSGRRSRAGKPTTEILIPWRTPFPWTDSVLRTSGAVTVPRWCCCTDGQAITAGPTSFARWLSHHLCPASATAE